MSWPQPPPRPQPKCCVFTPFFLSPVGDAELGGAGARSRGATSVAVLYFLVALSFVAWVLLFALGLLKRERPREGPRWVKKRPVWLKRPKKNPPKNRPGNASLNPSARHDSANGNFRVLAPNFPHPTSGPFAPGCKPGVNPLRNSPLSPPKKPKFGQISTPSGSLFFLISPPFSFVFRPRHGNRGGIEALEVKLHGEPRGR